MSPEQIEGREADARADLFAFGAVVYEMVTRNRAFEGTSQASLIGSILKDTPKSISAVRPVVPATLDRLVTACLEKDPDERWQDAHDLRRELKWLADSITTVDAGSRPARRRMATRLAWSLAILAARSTRARSTG